MKSWSRRLGLALLLGATLAVGHARGQTRPANLTLDVVEPAMGASGLNTIQYAGAGYVFGFQQAPGPGEPWPLFVVDDYRVSVDYTAAALRVEMTRAQGEHPPRGGAGQPIAGNPRTIQYVQGRSAWSEGPGGRVQPNPNAVSDRLRQLWMTPHGLVKAARAAGAKVAGRVFVVPIEGLPITVHVDERNLVDRATYLIDSPVLGDVAVALEFADYAAHNGVQFPSRIIERTDGYLTLDVAISDVRPGATVAIAVPAGVTSTPAASTGPPQPTVVAAAIATGVWHIVASGYASVLVEFRDFLVMFEGPVDDARSTAVNEWVRRTIPGKPLRYLVNTHAHFDHAGGVRSYVAEGVTIITHEMNRSYYEQVWTRPRTLKPDRLSLSPRSPRWETMTETKVVTDGARTLELHKLQGNGHNPYLLVGYLPADKMLLYGDMYNPPDGPDPRDLARTNEYADNLYDNVVNRLKLDVRLLVPVHGRPVPFENLKQAIGLSSVTH